MAFNFRTAPFKPYTPPSSPSVGSFIADITNKTQNRVDPGVQARMAVPQAEPIEAQQQAFQSKLTEYNDWSKNITRTMQQGAVKRRGQEAAFKSARSLAGPSTTTVNSGGGGYRGGSRGWGGYSNGQIPANKLSRVSFAPNAMLRSDAAQQLERMNAAYRQATGRNIGITDSYRSLQGQINVARKKPGFAAKPGTSVHGLGLALDLNVKGDPVLKRWLDQNAGKFGFGNPNWAKNPKRYEPWHWEYSG